MERTGTMHRHPAAGHAPARFGRRRHRHDHAGTSLAAAESTTAASDSSRQGIRAVKVGLAGLAVTGALQLVVAIMSGSAVLLADAIHKIADTLTALPMWIAFVVSRRPPNRRFTYGYGRAEDLAGIVIVAFIAASAVVAGCESVRQLLDPRPVRQVGWVLVAG